MITKDSVLKYQASFDRMLIVICIFELTPAILVSPLVTMGLSSFGIINVDVILRSDISDALVPHTTAAQP